jgi:transcriptional regulator with XRE-family HTH domain
LLLVEQWREDAGLSQYALTKLAGTPASTIRRIENGDTDPTITMLERIATATGRRLELHTDTIDEYNPTLAALATHLADRIDWTQIRRFADWTEQHPTHAQQAIATPPARTGSPRTDNLLAAIAEIIADLDTVPRPRWTRAVKPLDHPWHTEGTPIMQARSSRNVPPQFAERNIRFGADTVWHTGRRVLS